MNPLRSWQDRKAWREALDRFLDRQRLLGRSEATIRNLRKAVMHLAVRLRARLPHAVTSRQIAAHVGATLARVGRATARQYVWAIRKFFGDLVESGELLVSPAEDLPLPRSRPRLLGRILTRNEMARLLSVPDTRRLAGIRDRALVEFLYATGLRASELRRLKVEDVDDNAVRVRAGKGGKDRIVPLARTAQRRLEEYLAIRPKLARYRPGVEELFLTRWGKPFGECMLQQHLRKLGARAGLRLTCHTLRRTFATHLIAAGASPAAVAALLGHGDLETLGRYAAVSARELKETHRRTHPREADDE